MECICVQQYQDIKPGMVFEVTEIYQDYYVLTYIKGCWSIEVSNKYFNECFKINL